jgi:hypothetical protein
MESNNISIPELINLVRSGSGAGESTYKQNKVLLGFTGLPFWAPIQKPKPTVKQASALIGLLMAWKKDGKPNDELKASIVALIQIWFPDFQESELKERYYKGSGQPDQVKPEPETKVDPKPEPKPETKVDPKPEPKPETKVDPKPEPKPETKVDPKPEPKMAGTFAEVLTLINAGFRNIWLVGPAGSGKTTICQMVANHLDRPFFALSCNIGTSPAEIVGYKYPERESSAFAGYYQQSSIIVLDEFTSLDPAVASVANRALANNNIETTTGIINRDPDCVIIATSNTFGDGPDRQYVANNQLDGATKDRFVGAVVNVDYDSEFEKQYDQEVVYFVGYIRKIITQNKLRKIASTRMVQAGHNLKKAGLKDWKDRLLQGWSANEINLLIEK